MTSTREQKIRFGERVLRELIAGGEIEPDWRVAYETLDDSDSAKVYRLWFEKLDHSDSFGVRVEIKVEALPEGTEEAAVEEIRSRVRARCL